MKTLLIGTGRIGYLYDKDLGDDEVYSHTKALNLHKSYDLVSAVEVSEEARTAFEKDTGVKTFSNIESAIKETSPDLVVIAVPTEKHLAVLKQVLTFGIKNIVLEKPLANCIEEARSIKKCVESNNASCVVNYIRLFDPVLSDLAESIRSKQYGELIRGRVLYSNGLFNCGSHYISYLLSCFPKLKAEDVISNFNPVLKNDLDISFIAKAGNAEIVFQSVPVAHYSLGEIELFLEGARITLTDFTNRISMTVKSNTPNPRGVLGLGDEENIETEMNRYQYNVYEAISGEENFNRWAKDSFVNAFLTINVLEEIQQKARNLHL